MSTPLLDREGLAASEPSRTFAPPRAPRRRIPSLIRLVLRDPRAASLVAVWYAALVLGWQPGLPGAFSMLVFAPVWLVLGLLGLLFLPENLLLNLQLEIPQPFGLAFAAAFLLLVAGLHAWLYFRWRWGVLALLALLLCASSWGCMERFPSLR